MATATVTTEILDWRLFHRDLLNLEILRGDRKRATILAALFAIAASIVTFFAFVPGPIDAAFRARLQSQWPRLISVYAVMIAYELALRIGLGWLIEQRRQPRFLHRLLNACFEASIPTVMMLIGVEIMGARDVLGSPAFLLYFFFIMLSILQLDARLCLFTGLVAAVEYFLFAGHILADLSVDAPTSFAHLPIYHFNRSLILFAAGAVAGLLARQLKLQVELSLQAAQERNRAIQLFGQYVSPQIAEKLLHQPVTLGGELRNVCVMFLDIRDFTRFAAANRPEVVMDYLNTLFDFMIDVVNQHQGIINKFLGDGFMAVFGAPIDDSEKCMHAVRASMAILARLDELNAAGAIAPTRVGIGLHMGEAIAGNVGSAERKEYAIIGEVVNVASRIEQATKDHRAQLLISAAVREALDDEFKPIEDLGAVALKGQPETTRIFKLA
jgi:adenylate cyclase